MKRWFLFFAVNILVMLTITVITSVFGLDRYYTAYGLDYQALMVFCLVWGMGGSIISLFLSKFMAKMAMGVQIVDESTQYGDLVRTVHRMAKQAGITSMPEVGVYQSPDVNAFATGPSKNSSLIAVSTGLLERMNRDEVEGVIGHEIAHAANGDMVTMALVQGVVNAFVMFFSRIAAFAISNALRSNDDEGRSSAGGYFMQHMMIIVFQIIFGILAMPITAWFSRYREFRADAGGAALAGREKMISALEKLKATYSITEEVSSQVDSSYQAFQISSRTRFTELISTHPPLEKRIEALKRRA